MVCLIRSQVIRGSGFPTLIVDQLSFDGLPFAIGKIVIR